MSEQAASGGEWVLIGLDEKLARKQGVPARIPVPKKDFEGLADKGLSIEQMRKWVAAFMQVAPSNSGWRSENAALVKSYEAFMAKADLWNKAQASFAKGDMKGAIGTLRMLSNLDPNDHASKLNLASALANTGDYPGARKHFEAIQETFGDDADFHVAYANVLLSLNEREPAKGELVLALEADPSNQAALDALKGLGVLIAIYDDPRDAASLTYVRTDSVLAYLEELWKTAPRDVTYWLDQINYHELEKRPQVVLAAATRALESGLDDARLVVAKINALRDGGDAAAAVALAKDYVAKHDGEATAHVQLARALADVGDGDGAHAAIERALAIDPGDLMALDMRFWPRDRHDLQQVLEAIPPLTAHADKHPNVAGVLRSLARAKLITGNSDVAFELFEKAVSLAPQDDDLRAEWWGELARLRHFELVIADAAKLTDLGKRDWKLRWNEAEAFAGLEKKMEAQAAFAAINRDESLHVDVRKRAKRAASSVGGTPDGG